jgi:hypothetical protein
MYCAVDRIFLADGKAANRVNTRAVVIYMRTPFHKREAMIKLKRFLAHWQVQDATVHDCFLTEVMERARHLASYGAHLRRTEDSVRRYQVVNRRGEPVLQVAGGNGRYVNHEVDEVALKALIAGQTDNRPQREADRGKMGARHAAKNKRNNASKKSSGRSSPMATDEDSTLGTAIPASSVNAVPQGRLRKTTNLASANLSRRDRSSESEQVRETARVTKPSTTALDRPRPPHQPRQLQHQLPPQQQRQHQQEGPLQPHQPQLLQPHPQRQDGRTLVVPQPGNGLRQVAPPVGMANMASHGQHCYPAVPAHQGPVHHSSDYACNAQGGPIYVPYEAPPMSHGGHPSYAVGHYGPAPTRFIASQPQPAGYYRNGDSDL